MGNLTVKLPGPKGFWDILKQVSLRDISQEAAHPLNIALVGTPAGRENAMSILTAGGKTSALPVRDAPVIKNYDSMNMEEGFPKQADYYDFIIDLGAGREGAPDGARIYSVSDLGGMEGVIARMLSDRPEMALALARNLTGFRDPVARDIIARTSGANAEFTLLSGLAEQVPLLGAIGLPGVAFSDIVVLTKNQVMMAMRLAAAYGLEIDYQSRLKELAPILGNAFGWRAVARELVGAVPVVGFLPRAAISYAGTITCGRALQFYYETGRQMSPAQIRKLYKEALKGAREKVRQIASRKQKRTLARAPQAALPPASDEDVTGSEIAEKTALKETVNVQSPPV